MTKGQVIEPKKKNCITHNYYVTKHNEMAGISQPWSSARHPTASIPFGLVSRENCYLLAPRLAKTPR